MLASTRLWVFGAGSPVKSVGLYELLALRRGTFCNLQFSLHSGSNSVKEKWGKNWWYLHKQGTFRSIGKVWSPPTCTRHSLTLASALWLDFEWILWAHITNTCLQVLDYTVYLTLCARHFFLPPCDILYLFGSYGNCSWLTSQWWIRETSTAPEQPKEGCLWLISSSCVLRSFIIAQVPFLAKHLTMFLFTWQIRCWCASSLSSILVSRQTSPYANFVWLFLRGSLWWLCWDQFIWNGI